MARRVFFSFHYQRDVWRVNQIRNLTEVVGTAAAGFQDGSLWEESKRKGDATIKQLIDEGLHGTSVTVVCIGSRTAERKYVGYEISESIKRGNGLLGIMINHLKVPQQADIDPPGAVPALLIASRTAVLRYTDATALKRAIEAAATAAGK